MSDDPAGAPTPEPLSPTAYHVLLALGGDALHGYAIMRTFEEMTDGAETLLPGTLYATLGRMLDAGLVEEAEPPADERSGGAPRRYYRSTARGRDAARAESARLHRLVQVARRQELLPESSR